MLWMALPLSLSQVTSQQPRKGKMIHHPSLPPGTSAVQISRILLADSPLDGFLNFRSAKVVQRWDFDASHQ